MNRRALEHPLQRTRKKPFGTWLALITTLFAISCAPRQLTSQSENTPEIIVAAAANLTDAFDEIGKQFTAKTGLRVVFSFAATADLAKQIENGGPFDVFAAADVEHIDDLARQGVIVSATRAIYGQGRLVLWKPPQSDITLNKVEDVANAEVKVIAIAKPEVAPYGRATVEALRALGLWSQVEAKVVYGQSVAQTKQYAVSGNADLAFLPLALVQSGEGQTINVDAKLHQPINQAIGVVKASSKQEAARRFVAFVLSADGQAVLERFGYLKPSE